MWEEKFKSKTKCGPIGSHGEKALLVKLFRCDHTEPRLVRFIVQTDMSYSHQSSARTTLFDGDKWHDIDYLFGQEMKDKHDNSIAKIFETLQKRAETMLTYRSQ